jgi:hypothetical protein
MKKSDDLRQLMKQKLSEKQSLNDGVTVLSGKERLQLLKSLKSGNGNSSSSQKSSSSSSSSSSGLSSSSTRPLPTSVSGSTASLPADFFDSGFSLSSSTPQQSTAKSTDLEKRGLSTSIVAPSAGSNGFPAGFFDNPYEEKHALQSVGQSSSSSSSSNNNHSSSISDSSTQQKEQNNLNQDPDLVSFMEDIHTISSLPRSLSIEQEIAVFDALETGASREDLLKLDEIEGEAINEERISEQEDQEPLPLLPMENEETYEKLVQSAHLAKLGLFYSKLEQMSNNKQKKGKSTKKSGSASSALLQEQDEIEKEIKELEFMISNSNEVDDMEVKPSDPSNMVEALYLKKLKTGKRKHDEVEEEIQKEKKVLHNDKRLKHQKVEKEDDDNDEESDDEESEEEEEEDDDDEESENERNSYNPLEFF